MLSCSVLELVVFEILDVLSDDVRWYLWRASLSGMMCLLLFVLPLAIIMTCLRDRGTSVVLSCILTVPLFAGFLYCFWRIGDPFPLVTQHSGLLSMEQGVGRIGVLGVMLIAALSGFGSVFFPYDNIALLMRDVSPAEIDVRERQLMQTLALLVQRQKKRALLLAAAGDGRYSGSPGGGSAGSGLWRQLTGFLGSSRGPDLSQLDADIGALGLVARQMFAECSELRNSAIRLRRSRTLQGRALNLAGYVLSLYCLYRIGTSAANVLLGRVAQTDPLSRGFDLLLHYFGIELASYWKLGLTFAMIGVMILASIRGFLLTLAKVFHSLATNALSINLIALVLAEVMGMYFVSSLLLLRMNLPPEHRVAITRVLGNVEFSFYHRWFDVLFLVSALLSIAFVAYLRLASLRQQRERID